MDIKRPRGRPKKAEYLKYTGIVHVRVLGPTMQLIEEQAAKQHMSVTAWVRMVVSRAARTG